MNGLIIPDCKRITPEILKNCGLFEPEFYMAQFRLDWSGLDPAAHFLNTGASLLASPGPAFDSRAYLDANPDILASGLDPLSHYLLRGFAEGRNIYASYADAQASPLPDGINEAGCISKNGILAIYAASLRHGKIRDSLIMALEDLHDFADAIIFASDSNVPASELLKIRHLLKGWAFAPETGLRASYLAAMLLAGRANLLDKAGAIAFCNDTAFAPVGSYQHMLEACIAREEEKPELIFAACPGFPYESAPPPFCMVWGDENLQAPADLLLERLFGKKGASYSPALVEYGAHETGTKDEPCFLINPSVLLNALADQTATPARSLTSADLASRFAEKLKTFAELDKGLYNLACSECRAFMAPRPRFSLIMPVYENARAAVEAIKAFLSQDSREDELIIVDDGSGPEMAAEINYRFGAEIESGRLVFIENKKHIGETAARLKGIANARHEWRLHISPYAKLSPGFLSLLSLLPAAFPEAEFFHFGVRSLAGRDEIPESPFLPLAGLMHKRGAGEDNVQIGESPAWNADMAFAEQLIGTGQIERLGCPDFQPNFQEIFINPELRVAPYWQKRDPEDIRIATVLPVFQHVEYLAQAIDSALMQKGSFLHQIILADDASTDGSREVCEAYARRYPDMIDFLPSEVKLGASRNIRRAILAADADLVCLLSGDDYWTDDEKISSQLEFLQSQPDLRMCFSASYLLEHPAMSMREIGLHKTLPQKFGIEELSRHLEYAPVFSGMLCDASILKAMPPFSGQTVFSEFLAAVWFSNFGPIGFLPRFQLVCRKRPDSFWHGMTQEEKFIAAACLRSLARMLTPANRHNPLYQTQNWYENQIAGFQAKRKAHVAII